MDNDIAFLPFRSPLKSVRTSLSKHRSVIVTSRSLIWTKSNSSDDGVASKSPTSFLERVKLDRDENFPQNDQVFSSTPQVSAEILPKFLKYPEITENHQANLLVKKQDFVVNDQESKMIENYTSLKNLKDESAEKTDNLPFLACLRMSFEKRSCAKRVKTLQKNFKSSDYEKQSNRTREIDLTRRNICKKNFSKPNLNKKKQKMSISKFLKSFFLPHPIEISSDVMLKSSLTQKNSDPVDTSKLRSFSGDVVNVEFQPKDQ